MLDTLLLIGNKLREAGMVENLSYIESAPSGTSKLPVKFLSVPVTDDLKFQLDQIDDLKDEHKRRLFLNFKTSGSDSTKKYLLGDILYGFFKNGGYGSSNYRLGRGDGKGYDASSFYRARESAEAFRGRMIEKFREEFERNVSFIENLLEKEGKDQYVFLHFDFDGKHWYEFQDELTAIGAKVFEEALTQQNGYWVLTKAFYKTLTGKAHGVPGFNEANAFKAKAFKSKEELVNLFYALPYSERALISEGKIKIVVLPKGDDIEATHITDFFNSKRFANQSLAEQSLAAVRKDIEDGISLDDFFSRVLSNTDEKVTQFDFVFSKAGGSPQSPDVDMIEVSGVQRSLLARLSDRVNQILSQTYEGREKEFSGKIPKPYAKIGIRQSFSRVLGDIAKSDKSKYQSHLFKVLPQIYTGTYYRDELLLPMFIKKTEFNIRQKDADFNWLKFDYYFLTCLRQTKGVDLVDEMKKGSSYQAGELLGRLARPLRSRINTFATRYAGQITRHMMDKRGLQKLCVEFNQKLLMHKAHRRYLEGISRQATEKINSIDEREFDKYECAFGFFEGYFAEYKPAERKEQEMDDDEVFDETERGEM